MSTATEREFKRMLSAEQAAAILAATDFAAPYIQTNVYYDTPDAQLKEAQAALRLRLFADRAEVTLKQRQPDGPRTMTETTDALSLADAQADVDAGTVPANGSVGAALTAIGLTPTQLHPFARVTTTRREAVTAAGTLVLDASDFADGSRDWELEMEYTDITVAQPAFDALVTRFGLTQLGGQNKVARAAAYCAQ